MLPPCTRDQKIRIDRKINKSVIVFLLAVEMWIVPILRAVTAFFWKNTSVENENMACA